MQSYTIRKVLDSLLFFFLFFGLCITPYGCKKVESLQMREAGDRSIVVGGVSHLGLTENVQGSERDSFLSLTPSMVYMGEFIVERDKECLENLKKQGKEAYKKGIIPSIRSAQKEEEAKNCTNEEEKKKLQAEADLAKKEAIAYFEEGARKGDFGCMVKLGNHRKEQKDLLQSLQWYVFAFQLAWLEGCEERRDDIQKLLKKIASKENLSSSPQEIKKFLRSIKEGSFFSLYDKDFKTATNNLKWHRLCEIGEAYSQGGHEGYLSAEDKKNKKRCFVILSAEYCSDPYLSNFLLGSHYINETLKDNGKVDREKGKKLLMQCGFGYNKAIPQDILNLGKDYYNQGKYNEAIDCFLSLTITLNSLPKDVQEEALMYLGLAYVEEKKIGQALPLLIQIEDKASINETIRSEVLLKLGCIYKEKREYEKALKYFQRSSSLATYLPMGEICRMQKKYPQATQYFKRALENCPDSESIIAAYQGLGDIYGSNFQYSQSAYYFEKVVELYSRNYADYPDEERIMALLNLGNMYAEGALNDRPNYEQALNYFKQINYIPKSCKDALAYCLKGKYDQAIVSFEELAKESTIRERIIGKNWESEDKESVDIALKFLAHNQLGKIYMDGLSGKAPDYKKAEDHFNKAGNEKMSTYARGMQYKEEGDYKKGIKCFESLNFPEAKLIQFESYVAQAIKEGEGEGFVKYREKIRDLSMEISEVLPSLEEAPALHLFSALANEKVSEASSALEHLGKDSPLLAEWGQEALSAIKKSEESKRDTFSSGNLYKEEERVSLNKREKEKMSKKEKMGNKEGLLQEITAARQKLPMKRIDPWEFIFLDEDQEVKFWESYRSNTNLKKLVDYLQWCPGPWELKGPGNPHVLIGFYKGHKCHARDINTKDRLVYFLDKYQGIHIIEWEGHYEN